MFSLEHPLLSPFLPPSAHLRLLRRCRCRSLFWPDPQPLHFILLRAVYITTERLWHLQRCFRRASEEFGFDSSRLLHILYTVTIYQTIKAGTPLMSEMLMSLEADIVRAQTINSSYETNNSEPMSNSLYPQGQGYRTCFIYMLVNRIKYFLVADKLSSSHRATNLGALY